MPGDDAASRAALDRPLTPAKPLRRAGALELLRCLFGRRQLVRVTGASMEPVLSHGDRVLSDSHAYRRRPPAAGQLVVARLPAPDQRYMVKLVVHRDAGGNLWLRGTNPAHSTDSRQFGTVPEKSVIGRVTSRL